jgi:hypothetical protein
MFGWFCGIHGCSLSSIQKILGVLRFSDLALGICGFMQFEVIGSQSTWDFVRLLNFRIRNYGSTLRLWIYSISSYRVVNLFRNLWICSIWGHRILHCWISNFTIIDLSNFQSSAYRFVWFVSCGINFLTAGCCMAWGCIRFSCHIGKSSVQHLKWVHEKVEAEEWSESNQEKGIAREAHC